MKTVQGSKEAGKEREKQPNRIKKEMKNENVQLRYKLRSPAKPGTTARSNLMMRMMKEEKETQSIRNV
jgi:hypothetical protein